MQFHTKCAILMVCAVVKSKCVHCTVKLSILSQWKHECLLQMQRYVFSRRKREAGCAGLNISLRNMII